MYVHLRFRGFGPQLPRREPGCQINGAYTMTPEFVIYGIVAASAALDLICNICKLAQWLIKKR